MKKRFLFLGALLVSSLQAKSSVVINEMMPRNVSFVINENFNFDGWVEVYNSGAENVDLSDLVFSDGKNTWESEVAEVLPPKGYYVFYFNELGSFNNANFKLDADGGQLILTSRKGGELDNVTYPATYRNVSYGRSEDGGQTMGHLSVATPAKSNIGSATIVSQAEPPCFALAPGFYDEAQTVTLTAPSATAKIYYTTDGTEPTVDEANLYTGGFVVKKNTPVRAIAVEDGKFPSDMATATYFINNRKISLPVVSIVTDPKMFFDDEIGMLVVGVNGTTEIPSYCSFGEDYANFWEDWERPCNFEIFDEKEKTQRLSMEVKAGNFGACSRTKFVKSIKLKASKVYGGNKMNYSIFNEKPNLKWKSVVLRNSGNDYGRSYLRDGYMQTLLIGQMDIDHQAYQPSVVYINGEYYGLLNIRERTNKDFVYSNYGLNEDEIYIEQNSSSFSTESGSYADVEAVATSEDMNADGIYERVDELIDLNEFLNYFVAEVYYANTDWAGGNLKYWKRRENGKWRWILYDTDFGYSCYGDNYNTNTFGNAEKNVTFKNLMKNDRIRERYITKFVIHLPTTFGPERCHHILDSLSSYIAEEANFYHDYLDDHVEADWDKSVEAMHKFADERPNYIFSHISSYFEIGEAVPMRIFSESKGTQFMLNGELVPVSDLNSKYFLGSNLKLKALPADGEKFDHWEIMKEKKMLTPSDEWLYFDTKDISAYGWNTLEYNDAGWSHGPGPLGFGVKSVATTTTNKIDDEYVMTSYFRKTIDVEDASKMGILKATVSYNDGLVIYVNGVEAKRINMPEGEIGYGTAAVKSYLSKAATETFEIDPSLFVTGKNVIAVEVHNAKKNNSLYFSMGLEDLNNNKVVTVYNQEVINEPFASATDYKAVFSPDPDYDEDKLKLYLNEICVTNKQYVDEYREDEDWIEIYNDGCEPIDLGGMYISDERKDLRKFQITTDAPALTTVPAKGYLVLWADGQPEQGALHTNFSLPLTRQQTVSLSREVDGEIFVIDSIRYEPHANDESFSRFAFTGFADDWKITSRPTFKSQNLFFQRVDVETVEAEEGAVAIYPNPTQDNIWFKIPWQGMADVQIYDGLRCVKSATIEDGEGIELSDLPSGIYFIVASSADGSERQTLKLLKK